MMHLKNRSVDSAVGARMSINIHTGKMDMGRLTILPVFTLLVVTNLIGAYDCAMAFEPVTLIKVATLIHTMLVICFYVLVVFLYLIRNSARTTTSSLTVKIIAVVSSFLPFAIPLSGRPLENPGMLLSANLITIFGIFISLYSLLSLGESFSIIPQARKLVQTGPYKLVRHPLYLGEFISLTGIVLARFSMAGMIIFFVFTALQTYRAIQEEKLLAGVFHEYESYSMKSARFIPGIF